MQKLLDVYNRNTYKSKISIISEIEKRKDEINEENVEKLEKLKSVEISNSTKSLIYPIRNLFSYQDYIEDECIDFSVVNFMLEIITLKPLYNDKLNIYIKQDNKFIDKKISQGVNITLVSKKEADIVFFESGKQKKGSNLLLYLDISDDMDLLTSVSKNFTSLCYYFPEREIDRHSKIYIYFLDYNENNNSINTKNFFIDIYNELISERINFYTNCITVMLNGPTTFTSSTFNFITSEKILDIM